mmetsp:Transcript_14451/g.29548  ORF Transcript_14451/g.29548 Transcript_14451/m.29548 type:complete len:255 (-) Transcript_14451:65-829(-)
MTSASLLFRMTDDSSNCFFSASAKENLRSRSWSRSRSRCRERSADWRFLAWRTFLFVSAALAYLWFDDSISSMGSSGGGRFLANSPFLMSTRSARFLAASALRVSPITSDFLVTSRLGVNGSGWSPGEIPAFSRNVFPWARTSPEPCWEILVLNGTPVPQPSSGHTGIKFLSSCLIGSTKSTWVPHARARQKSTTGPVGNAPSPATISTAPCTSLPSSWSSRSHPCGHSKLNAGSFLFENFFTILHEPLSLTLT